jgi:hypothetical protein
MECGMVHAAVSGYDYSQLFTGTQLITYKCAACRGRWSSNAPGSRFLVIYDGESVIQVILNDPPDNLLEDHLTNKLKHLRKQVRSIDPRDTIPVIPMRKTSVRIRATDSYLSDQIWKAVLANHDGGPHVGALEAFAQTVLPEHMDETEDQILTDCAGSSRSQSSGTPYGPNSVYSRSNFPYSTWAATNGADNPGQTVKAKICSVTSPRTATSLL